jgi:hypothetical protein
VLSLAGWLATLSEGEFGFFIESIRVPELIAKEKMTITNHTMWLL